MSESTLCPVVTVNVSSRLEIGRAVQAWQATLVNPGEQLKLKLVDGQEWVGHLYLSREDDNSYHCYGMLFQGDKTVLLDFQGDPDGPIGLPIRYQGRTWTDQDEAEESSETLRAAFYASGTCFTRETAPKVKPILPNASTRAGDQLKHRAAEAEKTWQQASSQASSQLRWFRLSDLLNQEPETDWTEPRKMPRPLVQPSSMQKRAQKPRYLRKRSAAVL